MTPEQIHNNTIDLVTRALRAGAQFTNVQSRLHMRVDGGAGTVSGGQAITITLKMPPGVDLWNVVELSGAEHLKQVDVEVVDGDAPKRIERS